MRISILVLLGILGIIGFTSCTKDNPPSPYYIKATIDGKNVVYNGYVAATRSSTQSIQIYGHENESTVSSDGIDLQLSHTGYPNLPTVGNIDTGIFTDTANLGNVNPALKNFWNPDHALISVIYEGNMLNNKYASTLVPFICTITHIDNATVSGTFSGVVTFSGSNNYKTITNGSFYVPF
ncbi:hypothetical protein [Ferruginibacter albus]|uniref:hypothetical protein n=1 Tax=Ferruginibacter albus TaxID=2875540 RepID=UPI001CC6A8ED|nr:hypothetical protein [Ferruginibacter albus]UAY53433.1 hypothetical protein K9M53_07105 [Ferruginibacter albus]